MVHAHGCQHCASFISWHSLVVQCLHRPFRLGSFSALASNSEKQASQRGKEEATLCLSNSTRLSTGQAEDLPDQFSEWGIGEWSPRLSPHFMRKERYRYFLQVPAPPTACPLPFPALPYLGPKAVYLGQGSLFSSPWCSTLTQSHAYASISGFLLFTFARQGANRCDSALSESWLLMRS